MARMNTALAAQGAEFLVLARLLIEGVETYKSYVNHPGYDLLAIDPERGRQCRISVKSRFATDFDGGFPVGNLDFDVLVAVALNRGYRYRKQGAENGLQAPDLYVLPVTVVRELRREERGWHKVFLRHIDDLDTYRENFEVIRRYLQAT